MTDQKITPCLWFDGSAQEAAKFYASVFPNSKILETVPYSVETPSNKPIGSVMTVSFELDGYKFLALNGGPFFKMNPAISFHVKCRSIAEVDAIWKKLSEGSKVMMPLGKYPFSERFGWLEDKYGLSWQVIFAGKEEVKQRFTPMLLFVGNVCGKAEEAIGLYCKVFKNSAAGSMLRYSKNEAPEKEGTLKYASVTIEGQEFMAMDSAREHKFAFSEGISFIIDCKNQGEISYFYEKLSNYPESEMCGWLKDKFGVSWQLTTEEFEKLAKKKEVMQSLMEMKRLDINKLKKINERS